jgi:valyl-tRNA synthetase
MQGLVDLDAEIAKCKKKLSLARLNLEKVRKSESVPNCDETVPANVRLMNKEKVRG